MFAQEKTAIKVRQLQAPAARKIPGITTNDKFPNAYVDCHKLNNATGEWKVPSNPEK